MTGEIVLTEEARKELNTKLKSLCPEILYPCDPNLNRECRKTACHINGGPCHLTHNREYTNYGASVRMQKLAIERRKGGK